MISGIGAAPRRREDVRFLTGRGRYLDDLAFDSVAHAVVLRSPHAHARIERIDAGSFNPARCATNPLGVKGCGEAGVVAAFPAIGDALRSLFADDIPARRPGTCLASNSRRKSSRPKC